MGRWIGIKVGVGILIRQQVYEDSPWDLVYFLKLGGGLGIKSVGLEMGVLLYLLPALLRFILYSLQKA